MCKICSRKDRADIENAVLSISSENGLTVDSIAGYYECDINELKNHVLFHTPLLASSEQTEPSLARKMKLREADILTTVSNEYLVTLKAMGRRINRLASVSTIDIEDEDKKLELTKYLTKPMVDLYVGLGGEIRQNVKALAEVDRMLNGPQENQNTGLFALAEAIKGSGASG